MLKKITILLLLAIGSITVSGCSNNFPARGQLQNVGILLEGTIAEQVWGDRGHSGLMKIQEKFDVKVYYKEKMSSDQEVIHAVNGFVHNGVNLVFGHSNIYGKYFDALSEAYPHVHFVYINGGFAADSVTSLNIDSHAMGFFAGMVASKMTNTDKVGMIAAFEWQQEIEGYYEGVKYQNPEAQIHINYINDWNDAVTALEVYNRMKHNGVDVFYPAGNSFSKEIIEQVKIDDLYAIGYVIDQSVIDPSTVLTSTVQHVGQLYLIAAEMFNDGELGGRIMTFDFQDGIISLGDFSPKVPESYKKILEETIETYKETGFLPNENEA